MSTIGEATTAIEKLLNVVVETFSILSFTFADILGTLLDSINIVEKKVNCADLYEIPHVAV